MIKPTVGIGLVSFIVLSQSAIALAVSVQEVPNPRRMNSWVADTANLLTPQTEAEINRIATELNAKNGSEIAVVTVTTTKPSVSSKAFATELFNTWKIGKQGKNNGVLVLISKGDRRTEIETGTGLTVLLPDSKTKTILTQTVTPQYKQGKFDQGTLAGTLAIAQELSEAPVTSTERVSPAAAAGGAFVIVFVVYSMISGMIKGSSSDRSFDSGPLSSFNHSSSSDGGSDFGGGSSDGGGSGDSW